MTQRQVENERIGRMARSATEPLPFLCECDQSSCFELVWLSTTELAAHREQHRPVLAHPVGSEQLTAA